MSTRKSALRLKPGVTSYDLGRLEAEKDEYLAYYYVGREAYVDRALNMDDTASFFKGPKGVGKSAVLEMVRKEALSQGGTIIDISPKQLALSTFARMDVASQLLKDTTKNSFLYKSIWDYILVTEIGSREYSDENTFITFVCSLIRDPSETQIRRLLKLSLDDNGNPESLSQRFLKLIKEVEFSAIAGTSIAKAEVSIKAKADYEGKSSQIELLNLLHSVSTRLADKASGKYYVIIDDLDVDWCDDPVQNQLIAAMFSSLSRICKPPKIKPIASIQERIFRSLSIGHKDKFRDAVCDMSWGHDTVKEMIEKRIRHMPVTPGKIWGHIFPENGFDFAWDRTSHMPREMIRLVSLCLSCTRGNGHKQVEQSDMDEACRKFSAERLDDVGSELSHIHPGIPKFIIDHFSGGRKQFEMTKLKDMVDDATLRVMDNPKLPHVWIGGYQDDYTKVAEILLENRILLIKRSRTDPPSEYNPVLHRLDADGTFLAFHPMYHGALGLIGDV